MTLAATYGGYSILKLKYLTKSSRLSVVLLVFALWMQMLIGMNVIWNNVPINLASSHQVGAMSVLSCFMYSMHCARRIDPRHMNNMMGKLRIEDKKAYEGMLKFYGNK